MACKCLLISVQDFKNRVDLTLSIDSKKLIPSINIAQDRFLRVILCKSFYDEITTEACDGTITGANKVLFDDYIKPALVYRAYSDYLSKANYHSTASGIRKFKEENSDASSSTDLSGLIGMADSNAQYYEQVLIEYLENNQNDFPTWKEHCKCVLNENKFKISGIGFGRRKKQEYKEDLGRDYIKGHDRERYD